MSTSESLHGAAALDRNAVWRLPANALAFSLALVAFLAVVTSHLVDFGADDLRVHLLNANLSSSWSHVLDTAVIVAAAAVTLGGLMLSVRHRKLWAIAFALLALLAVDEVSPLHNHVDQFTWGKAIYAPLLVLFAVCVLRLPTSRAERSLVRVALLTLAVSFGIHVLGPHVVSALGWGTTSWAYQVKVALKQGTELAGWLLMMIGLWTLVSNRLSAR